MPRYSFDRQVAAGHSDCVDVREYDATDTAAVLAGMRILNACRTEDTPWLPPLTPYRREMQVRHSWDGTPERHFLACVDGVGVGLAELEVGEWDNRDFAWFSLYVDPACRRRGLAESAMAEASSYARDYELVRIVGHTPYDLLDAVVRLTESINDAPVDDLEVEDEVFTPERVQAYESHTLDAGHRLYRLVARHRASGELAGHTIVVVDTERPTRPTSTTPRCFGSTGVIVSGCC